MISCVEYSFCKDVRGLLMTKEKKNDEAHARVQSQFNKWAR